MHVLKIQNLKSQCKSTKPSHIEKKLFDVNIERLMIAILHWWSNKVKVTKSPDWLVERLKSIGQKVNNIVDVSNYVMFELGIPHIFLILIKLEENNI